MEADWDVVIVGRSYAGLSAALPLARMRRSVLVIGSGGPRNSAVLHTHGLLTRDGASPDDLMAAAEADLAKYPSVELVDGHVTALEREDDGFRVTFDGRTSTATKVILATGVNDDPLPIPGLAEHWGRGVFTCPFCDGYEHQDLPLAVVGDPVRGAHGVRLLAALSDRVTLYAARPGPRRGGHARRVRRRGRRSARSCESSATAARSPTSSWPTARASPPPPCSSPPSPTRTTSSRWPLGCSIDDVGQVIVDATGRTDVAGVWAVGDVTTMFHQMSIALAHGTAAGADCAKELILGLV